VAVVPVIVAEVDAGEHVILVWILLKLRSIGRLKFRLWLWLLVLMFVIAAVVVAVVAVVLEFVFVFANMFVVIKWLQLRLSVGCDS